MPILASDALVLRAYKMGETSKIVVLLSRGYGKVRAVAKGVRGRRVRHQSALEPLSEVRVSLYGRQGAELYRLGGCELIRSSFPLVGRSVEASLLLSYLAELLDAFSPEGQCDDAVYRLALAALDAAQSGVPLVLVQLYAEAWLLRLHGVYPPLDRCAGCGGTLPSGELGYHAPARGFVCTGCGPAAGPVFGAGPRRMLEQVFRSKPGALAHDLVSQTSGLDAFHQELITAHVEHPLRSHRVLREVALEPPG